MNPCLHVMYCLHTVANICSNVCNFLLKRMAEVDNGLKSKSDHNITQDLERFVLIL